MREDPRLENYTYTKDETNVIVEYLKLGMEPSQINKILKKRGLRTAPLKSLGNKIKYLRKKLRVEGDYSFTVMRKKFSEEEENLMISLSKQGLSYAAIANTLTAKGFKRGEGSVAGKLSRIQDAARKAGEDGLYLFRHRAASSLASLRLRSFALKEEEKPSRFEAMYDKELQKEILAMMGIADRT